MDRFLEKLKKVSHRASGGWGVEGGGSCAAGLSAEVDKPRSRSKVNKPGGVRLWRRVGKGTALLRLPAE